VHGERKITELFSSGDSRNYCTLYELELAVIRVGTMHTATRKKQPFAPSSRIGRVMRAVIMRTDTTPAATQDVLTNNAPTQQLTFNGKRNCESVTFFLFFSFFFSARVAAMTRLLVYSFASFHLQQTLSWPEFACQNLFALKKIKIN